MNNNLINEQFLKKIPKQDIVIWTKHKYLAISVPIIWFIASIPEWYSLSSVPIYTMVAIASITFIIDVLSDIKNNRIKLCKRTISFIILVLASIVLSVVSLGN